MKILYCWRCKQDVPMLDEAEYAQVSAVYMHCLESVKQYRRDHNTSLQDTPVDALFEPARRAYEELTGVPCHHDHIKYHCIARYGPPCPACGKPLRTSEAAFCAACGHRVTPGG